MGLHASVCSGRPHIEVFKRLIINIHWLAAWTQQCLLDFPSKNKSWVIPMAFFPAMATDCGQVDTLRLPVVAPFWILHRILVACSAPTLRVIIPVVASEPNFTLPTISVDVVLGN